MHQLLLLRHANAAKDDPPLSDHARPLSAAGRQAATAMRGALRELGLQPDVVLVSSARRALETLDELEPWDEMPLIEPLDALYMATSQQLLKILRGIAETVRSALIIGHNPGLHELALLLVGGKAAALRDPRLGRLAEGFPAAALAEFTLSGPWRSLSPSGARPVRLIAPSDLPA
jgi:phosphohistidine phosphatase